MGPTNSGKTYAALQHLAAAPTGTYLAPLRLLALENYEGLAERGLKAGMVTGEEVLGEERPTHTSRTIETADLTRPIDVAVIDEIQMLSDPDRGWAWTNALFGIPAKTVIVCGSDDALAAVQRAAEAANESLEVITFVRKTPLVLMEEPVPLENVEPGDAVVAFSRRAVHENREILVAAGHSVATIYGALSPEVRRAEAARFRTGEATVLVTTDAIGMGLNLGPLKRIVFSATRKWDGVGERALTNSEIRQIAGRAGRFGHQDVGYVAATDAVGIEPIRAALAGAPTAPAADTRFFVRPDLIAIRSVAEEMRTQSLREVMTHFARSTFYAGSPFQPSALDEILDVAKVIDRAHLPIEEKFAFSVCPVNRRDEVAVAMLERWGRPGPRARPFRPCVPISVESSITRSEPCGSPAPISGYRGDFRKPSTMTSRSVSCVVEPMRSSRIICEKRRPQGRAPPCTSRTTMSQSHLRNRRHPRLRRCARSAPRRDRTSQFGSRTTSRFSR